MKDIKAVTRDKALAFYRRFYAPNNAVRGDRRARSTPTATLELIARSYGAIPPSEAPPADDAQPERAPAAEVRADADTTGAGRSAGRRLSRARARRPPTAPPTRSPTRSWPAARRRACTERWSSTRSAASSVRGDVAPTRDPGLYAVWVQMTKGHRGRAGREGHRRRASTALAARPVPAAELATATTRLETEFWRELSSSHGRAEALGEFEIAGGDFREPVRARGRLRTRHRRRRPAGRRRLPGDRRALGRRRAPEARGTHVIGALLIGDAGRDVATAMAPGAAAHRARPCGGPGPRARC